MLAAWKQNLSSNHQRHCLEIFLTLGVFYYAEDAVEYEGVNLDDTDDEEAEEEEVEEIEEFYTDEEEDDGWYRDGNDNQDDDDSDDERNDGYGGFDYDNYSDSGYSDFN